MLLFRQRIPADWAPKVLANLPAVLVDHAHLERKAATTALNLEKYRDLYGRVGELNAIAIEELQHFQLVLNLLKARGIPFGQPHPSPWITGLMRSIRNGQRHQVIDHVEEHTIQLVLEAGFWAGMTLYPESKCTAARAADMVEMYGSERLWMNSACDWGVSVPLAVPRAALEMRQRGHTAEAVDKMMYGNPVDFLSQSKNFKEKP